MTTKTTALRDEALRLHRDGMPIPKIAETLGVPRITAYSWIPRPGEESQFAQMASLRASGMTNQEIARRFGVSRQRVSAVLGPSSRRGRAADSRRAVRVRLDERDADRIVSIADGLGIRVGGGAQAGRGSVNGLLAEIAAGNLVVVWNDGHTNYSHLLDESITAK